MELKGVPPVKSSWCITLLSFAECVTYIVASFCGDYLKGVLVYVNVIAAAALAFICIIWPYIDVSYTVICLISIGRPKARVETITVKLKEYDNLFSMTNNIWT